MKAEQRAIIAAIAAAAVNGRSYSGTYDFDRGQHIHTTAKVDDGRVTGYDFARSAHVTGTLPALFDFDESSHLQLNVDGNKVTGYDFGSSFHYSATVSGNSVSMYDYESATFHQFSVS